MSAQVTFQGGSSFPMNFVTPNSLSVPFQSEQRKGGEGAVLLTVKHKKSGHETALSLPIRATAERGFQSFAFREGQLSNV